MEESRIRELAAAEMTATAEPAGETPDTNLPAAAPGSPVPGATPDQTAPDLPPAVAARDGGHWLQSVWLLGALAMAGWFLAVNLRFRHRAAAGAELLAADYPIPVYVSPSVPSPCLVGLLRQRIYVTPAAASHPVRLRHVLAHELTHRRHGDTWWSLVRAVCLCLYWFDPLVWWAAVLSRQDCELACDEGAIRHLGEDQRLAYGRTLVDLVAAGPSPAGLLQTATTMHASRGGLKERVALIVKQPRTLAVTALCLLTAVALLAASACLSVHFYERADLA